MKEYRQDAHTLSLAVWAALCAAVTVFLIAHGGSHPVQELVLGAALLLFGPAALLVYILRARRVWVGVDPEQGIVVSGRFVLPWGEIERIERRRPRLRKTTGPGGVTHGDVLRKGGEGCIDWGGCFVVGSEGFFVLIVLLLAALVAFWLVVGVLVPLLLVPLLEVFAPFGDRLKIVARGRKLVLRDLRGADEFLREVGARAPILDS